MQKGIITAKKVTGDVYFLDRNGDSVLHPSKNIEVAIKENFYGSTLRDAVESAKKYAIGAFCAKVAQKMRGFDCYPDVRNIRVSYSIIRSFPKHFIHERLLRFQQGDQILRKGEKGSEFFWVIDGVVEIDGVEYGRGSVFGRAAFGDGIRKKNAYAKTDVSLVAINKDHPDLMMKQAIISAMFNREREKIKNIRPRAQVEAVRI
ncbi:MAG: cyclic nucleotide-binding domain-containing protein [Spirochaetales bacterium]|nr:cyclic nucleotide-binding domain-containing protein [Spirochaetales bacterium]